MKNLKLVSRLHSRLSPDTVFITHDAENNVLYTATTNKITGYTTDGLSYTKTYSEDLRESTLFPVDAALKIVGLSYMQGDDKLCVTTENGEMTLCDISDGTVELVGSLECQLELTSWSPDQEILLLVTDQLMIVAMTRDFDYIQDFDISVDSFGEKQFQTVGWGKKETQFQGSAGKYVKETKTAEEKLNEEMSDTGVKVVWRGDGQYFACSSVEKQQRMFRVWNRDFQLQYTSETLTGIESPFAWKPSGAFIAAPQKKESGYNLVFFEMNGLKHSELELSFHRKEFFVRNIEWNSDSTVMMILYESASEVQADSSHCVVQLWVMSNYNWSLKQSIEYKQKVTLAQWDEELSHQLHVLLKDGSYYLYKWAWSVVSSGFAIPQSTQCSDQMNSAYVSVVDGAVVKLTPFATSTVPPPMCFFQVRLTSQVDSVAFCHLHSSFDEMVVLCADQKLYHFSSAPTCEQVDVKVSTEMRILAKNDKNNVDMLHVKSVYDLQRSGKSLQALRHLIFLTPSTAIAAGCLSESDNDCVVSYELCRQTGSVGAQQCPVNGKIVGMCAPPIYSNACERYVVVLLQSGDVFKYSVSDNQCTPFLDTLGTPVQYQFEVSKLQVLPKQECNQHVALLALSPTMNGMLKLNNKTIATKCTSFAIGADFVLCTTSTHKLACIPISSLSDDKDSSLDSNDLIRSVERGSVIITHPPAQTKVVLQLPRGNLEVINPRPLVLSVVKQLLNGSKYKEAFTMMRKHRINMNLMHDNHPDKFRAEIPQFVDQVTSVDHLNLFLVELQREDCTKTLYRQYYPAAVTPPAPALDDAVSKVDVVCDKFLAELSKFPAEQMLLPCITAHVRKTSSEVKQALKRVQSLKSDLGASSSVVSGALKYLLVLLDSNTLFRESLATYDLELALMVAQASNDDPKEYMPFLNQLKQLEEFDRRYQIDIHLKNFASALAHLGRCPGRFAECVELIKTHQLHVTALELYARDTAEYKEVCKMYAEHLTSINRYGEAGIVLSRCQLHKQAAKCFMEACSPHQALSAAEQSFSEADYAAFADKLAERLIAKNLVSEAATVLEHESHDFEKAARTLIDGRVWDRALRVMRKHKLHEMIEAKLKPALEECCASLMSNLQTYMEKVNYYQERLGQARERKKQGFDNASGPNFNDMDSDVASDFGSVVTSSTASSSRRGAPSSKASSSRHQRKNARKRFSLKPGSRHEEEGLLNALHELYASVTSLVDDVSALLRSLMLLGMDERAKSLQRRTEAGVKMFELALKTIWRAPDSSLDSQRLRNPDGDVSYHPFTGLVMESLDEIRVFLPPKFDARLDFKLNAYSL